MTDQLRSEQGNSELVQLTQAEIQVLYDGLSLSLQMAQEFGPGREAAWRSARDKLAEASRVLQAVADLRGDV